MSEAALTLTRGLRREQSLLGRIIGTLRRLLGTRLAGFGLGVLAVLLLLAAFADVVAPYGPNKQSLLEVLQPPSLAHPLGTDDLGRDVLSRLIHGSRVSLQVGLISVGLAATVGVCVGLLAGYRGGKVDEVLMRIADALYSFPALILALAITAALGHGIGNAMIAIAIVYIPPFARLVRGQALSVREWDFVMAARVLGAGHLRIMFVHIWPNVTAPIIVQASLNVAFAIIYEASLSFLGVGVRPPQASWGSMLQTGYRYLEIAPWLSFFPGAAIFITVLGLNLLGDGLRAALDPKMRQRGVS